MNPVAGEVRVAKVEQFQRKHRTGMVTLLFTDIVGSTDLKQKLGDLPAAELLLQHHAVVRETLQRFPEGEEIETAGDSFMLLFAKPSEAVRFSLLLQARLRKMNQAARAPVQDRVGIHVGEVVLQEKEAQMQLHGFIGIAVDTCARVMSLAKGGQILMTRAVFDSARQVLKGEELEGINQLTWLNHGPYLLKGVEESIEICEVREAGQEGAPSPPTSSEKAQRQVRADEEPVLGWRPAIGQTVPNTRWVLEKKLGEGGFGEVWLGRNPTTKEPRVFKFCFQAERVRFLKRELTLFRLLKERVGDHPHLVRLHDVYLDQPPFYVEMDYVEGADLRTWCNEHGGVAAIPLEMRLEIVAQVADGLQAAHEAGIIHRDIKPANILIGRKGTGPTEIQVKLTDFGIGQVVSEEYLKGITRAGFTQTMMAESSSSKTGTQIYMAPELLAGKPASIRSDIYSLGVVLYQFLVGDFNRPVTTDWAKQIEEPLLREDLTLCFAGTPEERFAGAGQLARNLRALSQRRAARAVEAAAQATREKAAYRRGVIRTAALAGLVIAGFAWLAIYAVRQAGRAERTAMEESRQRDLARGSQYSAEMNLAQKAYDDGMVARALSLLEKHIPGPDQQKDLRGFEWRYLWRLCQQGDAVSTFRFSSNPVTSLAFPAEDHLVMCDSRGVLKVFDLSRNKETAGFQLSEPADKAALSIEGSVVAAALPRGGAMVWKLSNWAAPMTIPAAGPTHLGAPMAPQEWLIRQHFRQPLASLSSDGNLLALPCKNGVRIWDCARLRELTPAPFTNLVTGQVLFLPNGRLTTASANRVLFWSVGAGKEENPIETAHTSDILALACSSDGRTLATGSWDTVIRLWDLPSQRLLATLFGHRYSVFFLAISPDGSMLASASADETIKLWDISRRTNVVLLANLRGHRGEVGTLAFSPSGLLLASGSEDGTVRLWRTKPDRTPDVVEDHTDWVWSIALSPDDRMLASGSLDGTIRLLDLPTRAIKSTEAVAYDVFSVVFSPKGTILASSQGVWRGVRSKNIDAQPMLRLWTVPDLKPQASLPAFKGWQLSTATWHDKQHRAVAIASDGQLLASGRGDGRVTLWSLPSLQETGSFEAMADVSDATLRVLTGMQFSPDGRFLATVAGGGSTRLWHVGNWKLEQSFDDPEDANTGWASPIAFSPDSQQLALGSKRIKLWDIAKRQVTTMLEGHKGPVMGIRFSPDGKTLATGSLDHSVKLWNLITKQEVSTLEGHTGAVSGLAFSSDGTLLVSSSEDKTIRFWRAISTVEAQEVKAPKAR
jgi:WD40 repeat protein/class 3 adenylate cyclase/tRNA A-37 threonylcarbamoyl transferase component Bud32